MSMIAALVAGAGLAESDARLARMTALYEQACLQAFPTTRPSRR